MMFLLRLTLRAAESCVFVSVAIARRMAHHG